MSRALRLLRLSVESTPNANFGRGDEMGRVGRLEVEIVHTRRNAPSGQVAAGANSNGGYSGSRAKASNGCIWAESKRS